MDGAASASGGKAADASVMHVRGGAAVVVRRVVLGGLVVALRVDMMAVPVVGSVVPSDGSAELSSSAVDASQTVVGSSIVVVSSVVGSSGSGSGGGRKSRMKMMEPRITATKMPIKMAVCLSFLFFRWASPSFFCLFRGILLFFYALYSNDSTPSGLRTTALQTPPLFHAGTHPDARLHTRAVSPERFFSTSLCVSSAPMFRFRSAGISTFEAWLCLLETRLLFLFLCARRPSTPGRARDISYHSSYVYYIISLYLFQVV